MDDERNFDLSRRAAAMMVSRSVVSLSLARPLAKSPAVAEHRRKLKSEFELHYQLEHV